PRKRAEEDLLQSTKMESIGRLAGGIAHDFNNLLTAIMGYAELVEEAVQNEPETLAWVQTIQQATDRAAQLTRQLLGFARKQMVQPSVLDLNPLIQIAERILRRL